MGDINTKTNNKSDKTKLKTNIKPRQRKRKKIHYYFTQETENAIIEYINTTDEEERNKIYNDRIRYAFGKLVENIFNTFKFSYCEDIPINVQNEVISNLIGNIYKFNADKGKAFSYFSIIAKNYLIAINNKNYKNAKIHVNISESYEEDSVCMQVEDSYYSNVEHKELINLIIKYWDKHVEKIFRNKRDLNVAYAVIELFRNCDRIENFSKKTLYLYIRTISNCTTQQITKVLSKMREHQKDLTQRYYDVGIF